MAEDLAATISAGAESEPALEDLDADSLVETAEEAESPAGETPEEEEEEEVASLTTAADGFEIAAANPLPVDTVEEEEEEAEAAAADMEEEEEEEEEEATDWQVAKTARRNSLWR